MDGTADRSGSLRRGRVASDLEPGRSGDSEARPGLPENRGAREVSSAVGRDLPPDQYARLPDARCALDIGAHLTQHGCTLPRADHVDHIASIAGVDHVGIGSDFDGISSTPVGLEDVSTFPALFAELSRRGWSEGDLAKLAGENLLRVMMEAETVARRLQRERAPSMATIEELDGGVSQDGSPGGS